MPPKEAERIIWAYHDVLQRLPADRLSHPISALPCSLARIRWAFFVHLQELVQRKALTQRHGDELKNIYSLLGTFFNDNQVQRFESLDARARDPDHPLADKDQAVHDLLWEGFWKNRYATANQNELHSFISECLGEWDQCDAPLDSLL